VNTDENVQVPPGGTTVLTLHGVAPEGVALNTGLLLAGPTVMVRLVGDVLVNVTVCGAELLPTEMLPKFSAGPSVNVGATLFPPSELLAARTDVTT
jgi:hypothetical protein